MNTRKTIHVLALALGLILLTACGGDGGGGGGTTPGDPSISIGMKKTGLTVSYYANDDGDYQKGLEPSYTRDDATNIVTDHITLLQWQDNDEVADNTKKKKWVDAFAYCADLTLGVHIDWRVPSIDELMYIADRSKVNPSIDESVFEFVVEEAYWSSNTKISDGISALIVTFDNGSDYWAPKISDYFVRCVRGEKKASENFTKSNNIVTDSNTDLQWQDNIALAFNTKTWEKAIEYCENLDFSGYTDWRLPNFNELYYIADRSKENPAIDTNVFEYVTLGAYWSSSTSISDMNTAWTIDFYAGGDNLGLKTSKLYVRCVRAGQ